MRCGTSNPLLDEQWSGRPARTTTRLSLDGRDARPTSLLRDETLTTRPHCVRHTTRTPRLLSAVAGAAAIGASGCSNPFAPQASDYGTRVPLDRLRTIDRLEIEKFAAPVTPQ